MESFTRVKWLRQQSDEWKRQQMVVAVLLIDVTKGHKVKRGSDPCGLRALQKEGRTCTGS